MASKFFLYSYKIECSHCGKIFCGETGLEADELPEISLMIQNSGGGLYCECGQMKDARWWREPRLITSGNAEINEEPNACHPCA